MVRKHAIIDDGYGSQGRRYPGFHASILINSATGTFEPFAGSAAGHLTDAARFAGSVLLRVFMNRCLFLEQFPLQQPFFPSALQPIA